MGHMKGFKGTRTHMNLDGRFYTPVSPATFPRHILRYRNDRWAARTGLETLDDETWISHFGRFAPLPGSFSEPLALAYHGHQFRSYNPDIGDGRGFLFAQTEDLEDGRLLDFGTKGSGQTPWSRDGDGRLTLKGAVREILATEMLEALGVETSKTFSVIETGESLMRSDEPSPTRSAVLVRLSHGHIRIGTFQRQAFLGDREALEALTRHAARVYLPEVDGTAEMKDLVPAVLAQVVENTARTVAAWMAAGFVHGVLNTDNINITGESFDYGPWRFLPRMESHFTAAYFDEWGLYAFGRQPESVYWALIRFAECFLDFVSEDVLRATIESFQAIYPAALSDALSRRLGIDPADGKRIGLSARFLPALEESRLPFEQVFFDCYGGRASVRQDSACRSYLSSPLKSMVEAIQACPPAPGTNPTHPYFQGDTPCTMVIDEVEQIWSAIDEEDDWQPLEAKLAEIREMGEALT